MKRLHDKDFWRVESETWEYDLEDGYYHGYEAFQRGTSTPYPSRKKAFAAAAEALALGDWVKVVHYPSLVRGDES